MAEYYVIRDKNTGLYFRGKGVNRWGKHYNQASIYRVKGMAEHTVKEVSWRGEQAEIVPIQIVETSTDVVPKSEVAREIIGIIEQRIEQNNARACGIRNEVVLSVYRGRNDGYRDIKEIIEQKYGGKDEQREAD